MYWPLLIVVFVVQFWSLKSERLTRCTHKNATLFYSGSFRDIELVRHTDNFLEPFHSLPSIHTQSKVKSMTYDPVHREVLFVEESKPHQIQGIHRTVHAHSVIDHGKFGFDRIAVDTITGNVYFLDGDKGIGLCAGHGNGSMCTLLIELKANGDQQTELVVHARRGLLFWLQRNKEADSVLKMASMDGKHIRQLSTSGPINSISLNPTTDSLYIAYESQIARIDLNSFVQEWVSYDYASKFVYWNCNLYYLGWKYSRGHALRFYGQNKYRLIKENVRVVGSLFLLPDEEEQHSDQNPCSQLSCPGICTLTEAAPQLKAKCLHRNKNSIEQEEIQAANAFFAFSLLLFSSASVDRTVEAKLEGKDNNLTTFNALIAIIIVEILIIGLLLVCIRLSPEICNRIKQLFGKKKMNGGARGSPNITVGF